MKNKLPSGWEWRTLEYVCDRGSSNISQNQLKNDDGNYSIYGASGLIKKVSFYHQSNPYIAVVKDGAGVGRTMLLEEKTSVIGTLQYLLPKENVDIKYLYYFLLGVNFKKYISGSTIPHIYYKNYKNEPFLLIPISEQKKIVKVLENVFKKLDQAIRLVKENIENIKLQNESLLREVFKNSSNVEIVKLNDVCEIITDGTHHTPIYEEDGIIFLSSKNVTSKKIDWKNVRYVSQNLHAKLQKRVSPKLNDVLLAKNGTTGVAAIVDRDIVFDIYVSLALLRPSEKINPKYLLNFINSPMAKKQFNSRLKGVGVPNLHLIEIRQVEIPMCDIEKQGKIVQFLDEFQYKNNQLLSEYETKLECLNQLKSSILDAAFKGELRREFKKKIEYDNVKENADKQAMVIALAMEEHEKYNKNLYRTKGEKIVEIIEKHLDFEFGREAKKDAAGPVSFQHLVGIVEPMAKKHQWFKVDEISKGSYTAHKYVRDANFNQFVLRSATELREQLPEIRRILRLFRLMKTTHEAEVIATTYSGWNNLIIRNEVVNDEAVVIEARENWHDAKLNIDRQEFFDAIKWLKKNNLEPQGNGQEVK